MVVPTVYGVGIPAVVPLAPVAATVVGVAVQTDNASCRATYAALGVDPMALFLDGGQLLLPGDSELVSLVGRLRGGRWCVDATFSLYGNHCSPHSW